MPRPDRLVVVVGTGTEVGKTWVAAAALAAERADGRPVAARKPAQSFEPGDTTDADVLGGATGEVPTTVCAERRWLPVPMAPPMAADALGREPFTLVDLVDGLAPWPVDTEVGVVETAGGVRSPLATDGDCAAFTGLLEPDLVVLVADAGLGTINGVRLSLEALADLTAAPTRAPVRVVLNRFDPALDLHRRNLAWLRDEDGLEVVTVAEPGWERLVLASLR